MADFPLIYKNEPLTNARAHYRDPLPLFQCLQKAANLMNKLGTSQRTFTGLHQTHAGWNHLTIL